MPGRGTLEKEKPPIFGMIERGGAVVLHRLANVRQATIKPLILASVALGSLINTDEYAIYGRLPEWGFGHKTVNHGRGEYARDEDGDGFCEVQDSTRKAAILIWPDRGTGIIVRVEPRHGAAVLNRSGSA